MKKKIVSRIILLIVILIFTVLCLIKRNINIYVGDYSYVDNSGIDIQLKIDNIFIWNDSLYNNPFDYTLINKKLRYGVHTINISSDKAKIKTEKKIFLLPNQHIYIEFIPADTLLDIPVDTLFFKGSSSEIFSLDSLQKHNKNKTAVSNSKSTFIIKSSFNPFYFE